MTIEEMCSIRSRLRLTYQEICLESGVPIGTVQKVLTGATKNPRIDTLRALEEAFLRLQKSRKPHGVNYSDSSRRTASMVRDETVHYSASQNSGHQGTDGSSARDLSDQLRRNVFTASDREALLDEGRTELIDGVLYDMAAPSVLHQLIIRQIAIQLENCIRAQNSPCLVLQSPVDVDLDQDEYTRVQPDLLIICDHAQITRENIKGGPAFVMEVVSPSSRKLDYSIKLDKYRNAGVREYWVIDPASERILVYDLTHMRGEKADGADFSFYTFDDKVPVLISDGKCQVDMAEVRNFIDGILPE